MYRTLVLLVVAVLIASSNATARLAAGDLPTGTVWYIHVNVQGMRASDAGREIFAWLDDEVISGVGAAVGLDLSKEVERITAFSTDGEDYVALVEGPLTEEAQDAVMRFSEQELGVQELQHRGKPYYFGRGEASGGDADDDSERVPGYFSFAAPGKLIASSSEDALKSLLDRDGELAGSGPGDDAIFVISAEKDFAQAGLRTSELADDEDSWDSNILRNTEQAALAISDADGLIAVDATLIATDPSMTQSLASIVRGVIALQVFATDLEPELAAVLQNTRVSVDGSTLNLSTVLEPASLLHSFRD